MKTKIFRPKTTEVLGLFAYYFDASYLYIKEGHVMDEKEIEYMKMY